MIWTLNLLRYFSDDTGSKTVVRLVVARVCRQVQILVQEEGDSLVMVVARTFWLAFQEHAGQS